VSRASLERLCEVAGPVSRETFEDLLAFEEIFRKWSGRINLSAASTLDDLWDRHILDSAQLARLEPDAVRWVDLGSGGGFPGLVIGFLLRDRRDSSIELVESNRKKASFLQIVAGQFNLPARIHAKRIDAVIDALEAPAIVTARALAPLSDLLGTTAPWLKAGTKGLFHKGRDYRREVEESAQLWSFDLIEHPSKTDSQGVVLEISHLRENATRF
jgi:16S rRNA (guanine527-N7)-methyltransferase